MRIACISIILFSVCTWLCAGAKADDAPKGGATTNIGGIVSAHGGTISGVIHFKGLHPDPKPIAEIAGAAFCKTCYAAGELPVHDDLVIGKNVDGETLANVLVYVSKGLEGKKFDVPKDVVTLDQVGCMYQPHVVAVMVGQTLEIRNSDATLHNVMSTPRHNPPFNLGMPVKDQVSDKVFKEPEFKMNLRCFMHPWMSAYVHVLDHPFFAVTGADGTFTIRGLPPGEYEVSVLHESSALTAMPTVATVKAEDGKTQTIEFTYQMANQKP